MENPQSVPSKGRLVRVSEVQRESNQALWARIQYFKDGELLHDVRFVSTIRYGKKWIMIGERIVGDFIPKNRYRPMFRKAIAIIHPSRKQTKPATPLNLPL